MAAFGWASHLLAFMEQKPLHKLLGLPQDELHSVLQSAARRDLALAEVPGFRCPSDSGAPFNAERPFFGTKYADLLAAKSNYVGNHGTQFVTHDEVKQKLDPFGVFWPQSRCTLDQLSEDGTSNTILVGERSSRSWAGVWIGVRTDNDEGASGLPQALGITAARINSPGEDGRQGFSSEHPGGAMFVFADGHVEFLDEEINFDQTGATSKVIGEMQRMGLYQRLLRRNVGQMSIRK
jgi:prepilin-type processing-associated H-X9-DG protein